MSPVSPKDPALLITGASTGIGAATARAAAEAGYRLVLAARSEDKLTELASELGGPDRALVVRCDVTEMADNERAVAAAIDGFGRLDAVFANAGFGASRGFLEESPEHWREMVLTNILGVGLTIRASLPHMLSERRGHFLITSSIAGRRALPGSMYSASKHAVTAIGEALRAELREMHDQNTIRVTVVEPGMVDTPFFDNPLEQGTALEGEDIARAVIYALGQPEHVDVNEILIRPTAQSS
ncbi:SDR family oxidoreductase [Thermoleophilia bacterium SCSIO 60948]|nr:SDR family oxidoreductase [Thermoleophilia bacterium SCSIO 60948]